MLKDGKPEFCVGCTAKGDYCGPVEKASVDLSAHRMISDSEKLIVGFVDEDSSASRQVYTYDYELDDSVHAERRAPYSEEEMLGLGDSVTDGLIRGIGRCAGENKRECSAFSREVVRQLGRSITSGKV